MHSLPVFVRLSGKKVVVIGDGEAAAAKRRLVERAGATVVGPADWAEARLVFIALANAEAAEVQARHFRQLGKLVNVVDQPDQCDFTTPAIVDRDPVLIAIATGGASAGLAKALRQRLENLMPQNLGTLASALGKARAAMRHRWPDAGDRRRAIDCALAEGGPLDPLIGTDPQAVERWLAVSGNSPAILPGQAVVVWLDSPDPDQLRLSAARLLGQADVVWHDSRVPPAILDRVRADAVRRISETAPAVADVGPGQLVLWLRSAFAGNEAS